MKLSSYTQRLNKRLLNTLDYIKEQANSSLTGLHQIAHSVKFDAFPGSLLVSIEFDSQADLEVNINFEDDFQKLLHKHLLKQGIVLKNTKQHLRFIVK